MVSVHQFERPPMVLHRLPSMKLFTKPSSSVANAICEKSLLDIALWLMAK